MPRYLSPSSFKVRPPFPPNSSLRENRFRSLVSEKRFGNDINHLRFDPSKFLTEQRRAPIISHQQAESKILPMKFPQQRE